jgi:hypothetical protein
VSEVERLDHVLACLAVLALLICAFFWGYWVASSDEHARHELAACEPHEVVWVKPDGSSTLCLSGSARSRR